MPVKDNLSAYVRVDGSCLPEYNVEVLDDGKTIACWIPSEAGKLFDICATNTSRTCTISVIARVDGINSPEGRFLRAQQPFALGGTQEFGPKLPSVIINGFPGKSMNSIQPFVFSPCILIEGDGEARSISNGMGQIELNIWEAILEETTYVPNFPTPVTIPPLHINERAKKGIVHGIQLGEEVSVPNMGPWRRVKWVKEILKFVFKYRPIDVLRADGIAPPETTTRQSQGQEDIIDLTLEDEEEEDEKDKKIREIQEQLESLRRQKNDKKRKRNTSDAGFKRELKVEIDLT